MSIPFPKNMENPSSSDCPLGDFSLAASEGPGMQKKEKHTSAAHLRGIRSLGPLAQTLIWGRRGVGLRQGGYRRREEALLDLIHPQRLGHALITPLTSRQDCPKPSRRLSLGDTGAAGPCPGPERALGWFGGVEGGEEGHTQPGSPDMLVFREHWPFFLFRFPSGDLALDGGKVGRITEQSLGNPLLIQ